MDSDPQKDRIDLDKILLPKKESDPSPLSAQRVNAGRLFEQEQGAELPKPETASQSPAQNVKKEDSTVKSIETYSGAISQVIQSGTVSAVSIAAAEAARRGKGAEPAPPPQPDKIRRLVFAGAGVLLLIGAAGIFGWALIPRGGTGQAPQMPPTLIAVDQVIAVPVGSADTRAALMANLQAAKQGVSLPLGLVAQLVPAQTPGNGAQGTVMPAQDFLSLLAPDIPPDLLRTFGANYVLGVHSYDQNQALLILKVDSYETAYAGMLEWEPSMPGDLAPLFTRTPSTHTPGQGTASTTASTTPDILQTGFTDQVVENHDARVLHNAAGDILLLWTFLDRTTLVVTTNQYTLREAVKRVTSASLIPQP